MYNSKWYKQCGTKSIREHRLLAEVALGKPISSDHPVHHFGARFNGGELVICEDDNYHALLHVRNRARMETGDPHKRMCNYCNRWDDISNMELRIYFDSSTNARHSRYYHANHYGKIGRPRMENP